MWYQLSVKSYLDKWQVLAQILICFKLTKILVLCGFFNQDDNSPTWISQAHFLVIHPCASSVWLVSFYSWSLVSQQIVPEDLRPVLREPVYLEYNRRVHDNPESPAQAEPPSASSMRVKVALGRGRLFVLTDICMITLVCIYYSVQKMRASPFRDTVTLVFLSQTASSGGQVLVKSVHSHQGWWWWMGHISFFFSVTVRFIENVCVGFICWCGWLCETPILWTTHRSSLQQWRWLPKTQVRTAELQKTIATTNASPVNLWWDFLKSFEFDVAHRLYIKIDYICPLLPAGQYPG